MQSVAQTVPVSDAQLWAGRILSGLVVLSMLLDGVTKLLKVPQVERATAELGFPEGQIRGLGALILVCTVLYVAPRTSVLGAILLTAFLGGATAAKVRLEDPTLLFSVVMGVMVWAGLFLRDERLRALVPLRS
jgi:DoxX-like family